MKVTSLKNRSINRLRWTEYQLVEHGVKVREKDLAGIRETTVEYDRVGREATYILTHSVIAKLAVILFLVLAAVTGVVFALHGNAESLAWVFYIGAAFLSYIYYENTKREGYRLSSDYGFVFLSGKKSDVEAFVDALTETKINYVISGVERRLAVMDRIDVEKYLLALREGAVLTQEQYDLIRAKSGLEDNFGTKIGFGRD